MRRLVPLALTASVLLAPKVEAAACCLSSSAFGIGRLASWENMAFIAGGSAAPVSGRWDGTGVWRPNATDYSEAEWRANIAALVALHPRLQIAGLMPYVMTTKSSAGLSEGAGGLGDSQLSLRYEPVYQGESSFLPEIALTAGLLMPFGRTAIASQTVLGSDVTGRGAWVPSVAATFEWAHDFWFAQVAGGVTLPLPMAGAVAGQHQQYGPGWQATAAGGLEVKKGLVISALLRGSYDGALNIDGRVVPQSAAYDFGVGPNVSLKLPAHFTLQAGADVGLFASHLGSNRQGHIVGSLALRYAVY
jgi:hypothetical protein